MRELDLLLVAVKHRVPCMLGWTEILIQQVIENLAFLILNHFHGLSRPPSPPDDFDDDHYYL